MRAALLCVVLVVGLVGCARTPSRPAEPWVAPSASTAAPSPPSGPAKPNSPIVTPSLDKVGKIISINPRGRYAVLSYALGSLPAVDSRVYAYRDGFKVAELKVTGPAKENNTVADLVVGECQVGDEVRRD